MRQLDDNLFVVQASCLGDWRRITEEGPWIFRGCALMLEPYDGSVDPFDLEITRVQAWIQIHRIPPLYRKKEIVTQLAGKIGEIVSVGMTVVKAIRGGDFVRARVSHAS